MQVQYIDLRDRYDGDTATLKILLRFVQWMHPKFSLAWVLDVSREKRGVGPNIDHKSSSKNLQELKDTLAQELDFENEGHNLERCARELSILPYVYVPKVDWKLSNKVCCCCVCDGERVLNATLCGHTHNACIHVCMHVCGQSLCTACSHC